MVVPAPDDRAPYLRVVQALRAGIHNGTYPAGGRLPTRSQLAARFHVAPMTVQRAFDVLRAEGLIVSRVGAGTYVRTRPCSTAEERNAATATALADLHHRTRDGRCGECRDLHGRPAPWPCRTWTRLTHTLFEQDVPRL